MLSLFDKLKVTNIFLSYMLLHQSRGEFNFLQIRQFPSNLRFFIFASDIKVYLVNFFM